MDLWAALRIQRWAKSLAFNYVPRQCMPLLLMAPWNPVNSPVEVVGSLSTIIFGVSAPSQVVVWDFSHQQYVLLLGPINDLDWPRSSDLISQKSCETEVGKWIGWRMNSHKAKKHIHPQKLTWNLEMMVSNRNLLFQGSIFRFHVCFGGWIFWIWPPPWIPVESEG